MDLKLQITKGESVLKDLKEALDYLKSPVQLLDKFEELDVVRAFLTSAISGMEFWVQMKKDEWEIKTDSKREAKSSG